MAVSVEPSSGARDDVFIIAACLAVLAPVSGLKQFARNLAIAVLVLCVLMFIGATLGAVMREFLLEVQ